MTCSHKKIQFSFHMTQNGVYMFSYFFFLIFFFIFIKFFSSFSCCIAIYEANDTKERYPSPIFQPLSYSSSLISFSSSFIFYTTSFLCKSLHFMYIYMVYSRYIYIQKKPRCLQRVQNRPLVNSGKKKTSKELTKNWGLIIMEKKVYNWNDFFFLLLLLIFFPFV